MHIVRRTNISLKEKILIRAIFIFFALLVSGLLFFLIVNQNPIEVYASMISGAFGSKRRIWVTIKNLMMLTLLAVAMAPAYKLKFWNVGAEGQMLMGCIGASIIMLKCTGLPSFLMILLMLIASILFGGLWGFIPSFFKIKWKTNETLFTLMMNYIALQCVAFCVSKWEMKPGANTVGIINLESHKGWIPNLFSGGYNTDFGYVTIIVLALCILMHIYLNRSKHGFEIAIMGDSINTARYSGINTNWVLMRTITLSGALCGLAGFLELASISHTITTNSAGGRGFTAIIVAWLSKMDTFTMIAVSALIVCLQRGAIQIASDFSLSVDVSEIVTGIILFFILASEFFINYKLVRREK